MGGRAASLVPAAALGAVLVHALLRLLTKATLYLRSPYSRDSGEGSVLAMVQMLDLRGTCYPDMRGYPLVAVPYPPLFALLAWPPYRWLGPTLWVPRLLSLLATVAIAACVYGMGRRFGLPRAAAAAAGGLALAPWYVQTWAPLARVDMLALALSMAGLLAFVREARLRIVFPLFWLASFAKQSALLAPAAVLLALLVAGPPARFLRAAAGFVLPLAVLWAGLVAATHGEAYRHLVVYPAAHGFEASSILTGYAEFARTAWPLLALVVAAAVRDPASACRLPTLAAVAYGALSVAGLATIAKAGSAQNYLIEPWLGTVVAAMALLPTLLPAGGRRWAVLLVAAGVAHYTANWAHQVPHAIARPEEDAGFRRLWSAVAEEDGPILSENLAALVVNRKPVLVEPFALLVLSRAGLVRTRPVVRDCENEAFRMVVLEGLFEGIPSLRECLALHYRVTEDLPPYRLLRPVGPVP
jgi:hypothetical protein